MNNAPVAWREKYWGADVGDQYEFHTSNPTNNPNWIPLYTHPAKTEDEITIPKNSQDWKGMDGATARDLTLDDDNAWWRVYNKRRGVGAVIPYEMTCAKFGFAPEKAVETTKFAKEIFPPMV